MPAKKVEINQLPSIDDIFEKMRKVDQRATATDVSCAALLDISKSSITHSRARNTLPLNAIVQYCKQNKHSLDWMLNNPVDKIEQSKATSKGNKAEAHEPTANYSTATITEETMKNAMMLISAEITRAKAPFNDEVVSTLIKTYLKFKDSADSNIKMIIRAVAESLVE